MEKTRDHAIDAALEKYSELREKHNRSVLMMALKKHTVDRLNDGVRAQLKSSGDLPAQDVQISVRIGNENKTLGFAVGDYVQARKKTRDTGEDQIYNRTRGLITLIDGTGDDARISMRLYVGDKLTDREITIDKNSFREGTLCMQHAYAVTLDASQGMTVHASIEVDEGQGQQRKLVGRSRHRHESHSFANLDDLHRQAAKHMDADTYKNRNEFTAADAEGVLIAQWTRSEHKSTSLDYISDRNILAGTSCLAGSRFANDARIAAVMEKTAIDIRNSQQFAEEKRATAHRGIVEKFGSWLQRGADRIRVASTKPSDIKKAYQAAMEKFGDIPLSEIIATGNQKFRDAAKKIIQAASRKKQAATSAKPSGRDADRSNTARRDKTLTMGAAIAQKGAEQRMAAEAARQAAEMERKAAEQRRSRNRGFGM
jgi:hypothetical protein